MEITYTQQGDYLLPNLTLPEQDNRPIGLWGQQHLRYIKHSRPILYRSACGDNNTFAISNTAVRFFIPTCSLNAS